MAERHSATTLALAPLIRPFWPVLAAIGERALRAVDLPRSLAGAPGRERRLRPADLARRKLPENAVILVQDWFTALFDPDLHRDVLDGFTALGYAPFVLDMLPAGKAAQTMGDMDGFRKMAARLVAGLEKAAATGRPLVGLDPAFVMQLRQDYPKAGFNPPRISLPQEFIAAEMKEGKSFPQAKPGDAGQILSHCTEATGQPSAPGDWLRVFKGLGMSVETPATGCCGMAGLFGHEQRHQTVSRKLFDLSWRKHAESGKPMAATGFSCRCQVKRHSSRRVNHPLRLIADAMRQPT